jgi:predicted transcriptional regulator
MNHLHLRSRLEIISAMLHSMSADGAKKIEIQYNSYLSYRRLKTYLELLVEIGLVTYVNEERKFRITQKGKRALEALNDLDELMVQPVKHKQYGRGVDSRDSGSRNPVKFNIVK